MRLSLCARWVKQWLLEDIDMSEKRRQSLHSGPSAPGLNPGTKSRYPVVVLYPSIGKSELLEEVHEDDTMQGVLDVMLPGHPASSPFGHRQRV